MKSKRRRRMLALSEHFRGEDAALFKAWTTMAGAGLAEFTEWIDSARMSSFVSLPGDAEWYESVAQVAESLAYDNTDGPS